MGEHERNKIAADYLQRTRLNAGYTQQELADLIGTTARTIQNNESGSRPVIPSVIYGAGEHIGLDVDRMFAILSRFPPDLANRIAGDEKLTKAVRKMVDEWKK